MNDDTQSGTPIEPVDVSAFCETKLAAADIAQYYALLFLPVTQRQAAMALYAFWLELREIKDECTDPAVARMKLAWWSEELREMYAGRARHPAAKALAPIVQRHMLPRPEFSALLAGLERHIATPSYPTYHELREHGARTRGRIESLAARIVGHSDAELLTRAANLGSTLETIGILQNVAIDASRGRVLLPRDDLTSFGVATDGLRAGRHRESWRALLTELVDRLRAELTQHVTDLSRYQRLPLLACRAEITAAQALLEKIRRRPERVLHERLQVAPWRLLWIAWRAARRERRLTLQ